MSARIRRGSQQAIHVTKTIAFDGTAGNGAVGTVTVFTLTGRVWLAGLSAFCTETLAGNTATVSLGVASVVAGLVPVTTGTDLAANDWWIDATPAEIGIAAVAASQKDQLLSQSVIVNVLVAGVTDGTLVIDAWYLPVTSNGALS